MNLCVASIFDYTINNFRAIMTAFEQDMRTCVSHREIAVVNEHKVVTMLNFTAMDAFLALMSSPKMTEWDSVNNNVDIIYSLEKID